jgi:hypothetical protein
MKIIIGCIAFALFVLFMGRTEISFSPFFIRMPGWQNVVGWLFLLIGMGFLCNEARQNGYDKGLQDVYDMMEEVNKDYLKGKEESK